MSRRRPTRIVLHCSASPFGDAETIRGWHVDERGWRDIGYHYVICNGYRLMDAVRSGKYDPRLDGLVETGRPLDEDPYIDADEIGAHAYGHNRDTIGVCLIGDRHFTGKQFEALNSLVVRLREQFGLIRLVGHYELFAGKTCPNLPMDWVRSWCGFGDPDKLSAQEAA